MSMTGKRSIPEPLTPGEVRRHRLAPYEIIERWGYETNRHGHPDFRSAADMPEQMRSEFTAAQSAVAESAAAGRLEADYPQLYRTPGPYDDLVSAGGLAIHGWQA